MTSVFIPKYIIYQGNEYEVINRTNEKNPIDVMLFWEFPDGMGNDAKFYFEIRGTMQLIINGHSVLRVEYLDLPNYDFAGFMGKVLKFMESKVDGKNRFSEEVWELLFRYEFKREW